MGANDPMHNKLGKLDFWLGRQPATYARCDLPPQGESAQSMYLSSKPWTLPNKAAKTNNKP